MARALVKLITKYILLDFHTSYILLVHHKEILYLTALTCLLESYSDLPGIQLGLSGLGRI